MIGVLIVRKKLQKPAIQAPISDVSLRVSVYHWTLCVIWKTIAVMAMTKMTAHVLVIQGKHNDLYNLSREQKAVF